MQKITVIGALLLAGCGFLSVTDRYGNAYGGWYDPGDGYRWQLGVCDQRVAELAIPADMRPLAMRCCMYGHGVPIGDPEDC